VRQFLLAAGLLLLGMPPLAPLMMEPMRMVAMGGLVGHLIYGLILGVGYVLLQREAPGVYGSERSQTPGSSA
jgi:hypothetical protein